MNLDPLAILITDDYLQQSAYKMISNDIRQRTKTYSYLFYNNGANCLKIQIYNYSFLRPDRPYVFINDILTNVKFVHELENLEKYLLS